MAAADADVDDGGLGIVRIKPLGAGGGGVELRAGGEIDTSLRVTTTGINVGRRAFTYPRHVLGPDVGQQALYDRLIAPRVEGFLDGYNVNIMAYGQTGSGKTHTVFGPPGTMARAATGEFGTGVVDDYGLFPRGLIHVFNEVQRKQQEDPDHRYVLTASAVELSLMGNADMMMKGAAREPAKFVMRPDAFGVSVDKATKPPRLYGMVELPLDEPSDLLKVFSAIASRNTASTGMNDSSSRSHCFAFLTLWVYDPPTGEVRRSRFQFVDLAGSERMQEAHGGADTWEAVNGMSTNFSLTMLSACVRELVRCKNPSKFSFRAYLGDLVPLLYESMTGSALTGIFVCISQASANTTHTTFALDFGEVFSALTIRRQRVPWERVAAIRRRAEAQLRESEAALKAGTPPKYAAVRKGQVIDSRQTLDTLIRLEGAS